MSATAVNKQQILTNTVNGLKQTPRLELCQGPFRDQHCDICYAQMGENRCAGNNFKIQENNYIETMSAIKLLNVREREIPSAAEAKQQ